MKYYAVFGLFQKLGISGFDGKLPDGQYFIPVFTDYDKAKEHAGDRFEVVELSGLD